MNTKKETPAGVDIEKLFKAGAVAVFVDGERVKDPKKLPETWEKIARGHMCKIEGEKIVQDAKACVIRYVKGKSVESESLESAME